MTTLAAIANWGSGGTPPRKDAHAYGGRIPWLKTGELGPRRVFETEETITEHGLRSSSAKIFPAGAVAVAMYGATIGRASILGVDAATNQACAVAVPKPGAICGEYLYFYLCSQRRSFAEAGKGGAQPNISQGLIKDWSIPIAPVDEQKRIADKLDAVLARVETCRDRLDRVPAILKRFRQAVLDQATSGELTADWRGMLGRGFDWIDVRLGQISDVQGGVTKDSKKQSLADEDVPYLRVANVQRGYIDLAELKTIRIPTAKLETLLLRPGDVLFNEGGDIDKLGRGWVWEDQIPRCAFQNHVFRARLHDLRNQPKYISWWGNHRGLEYFLRSGKQTTNLASINKTMLCNLPILLPSPEEQTEIVRRVESLFAWADRLEARITAARAQVDRLTPALLAKAFRGELVPQDPADEPAAELLVRLLRDKGESTSAAGKRGRAPKRKAQAPLAPSPLAGEGGG